jgi:hypothetical protein
MPSGSAALERNRHYYERYADDRERVRSLHRRLDEDAVKRPSGDRLTWRRFGQLGHMLGMSDGAEGLHYILELPPDSLAFLHDVEGEVGFGRNPIYAVLHEASWADAGTTRWSAERMLPAEFDASDLFAGEHVYRWMFEDYGALTPLRDAADLLAAREWPRLYDDDVLRHNEVPTAAAVYVEDMYVERTFFGGDRGADPRHQDLDHQRVPAQPPPRGRRAHSWPSDRDGAGARLIPVQGSRNPHAASACTSAGEEGGNAR